VCGEVTFRLPSYTYPGARVPVLHDVYLTVSPGQTVGLVGRTGAGKTTLVNLLPRVYDPPPGTVFVDGRDVRSLTLDSLRRAIAYVPQDGFLFSDTLAENLRFGKPDAGPAELQAVVQAAAFAEALATFPAGLETVVGERGVMLSGGQRQRAAIARALLKDAPILILDDSLSAVDTATEARILDALRRLRQGRTTLLVAHRLSVVQHADWIVVLDRGTVVEQGTHAQLLQQGGLYADMYRLQALQAEGRA
ncbi:MAG: ATP-binding cassette domain-containing protein, partial [Alicyclobacillus sp.]|nr:ATP-binding cassette domain-containing protein [Alicyclobacillus sp.]